MDKKSLKELKREQRLLAKEIFWTELNLRVRPKTPLTAKSGLSELYQGRETLIENNPHNDTQRTRLIVKLSTFIKNNFLGYEVIRHSGRNHLNHKIIDKNSKTEYQKILPHLNSLCEDEKISHNLQVIILSDSLEIVFTFYLGTEIQTSHFCLRNEQTRNLLLAPFHVSQLEERIIDLKKILGEWE